MQQLSHTAEKNMRLWLEDNYDTTTQNDIHHLINTNLKELEDAFYTHLEFGTGGIRGLMGVGTNRMNRYTVGFATQGFANYVKKYYASTNTTPRVAIAHDSRINSRFFAETTAQIFAANGFDVFLFEDLRPTPELSFAIRQLKCHAGVVCTASHNPKEYNGYKVYWSDGAQIVEPHDKNILHEISLIKKVADVAWAGQTERIHTLGKDMDQAYINMVINDLCVNKNVIAAVPDLKIVYTPIHGTGITLVPQLLQQLGFKNIDIVREQEQPDGNFPTVVYPNPEEQEAMKLGLHRAQQLDADILLGTDPDSDRVSIGIKNHAQQWMLLNGNQTALLVFTYCIEALKKNNVNLSTYFIAKTIVTTDLIDKVAAQNNVACYNVLTGFKWIASLIAEKEGKEKFIAGGEESFGLLVGDRVRDKDAISAVAVICEMAAYYRSLNLSLYDALIKLYQQYGFYYEGLISITKKGKDGKLEIESLMTKFRQNLPHTICQQSVSYALDYLTQEKKNVRTQHIEPIHLPKANVLQLLLDDGSKISFRPSGTEPKIKYYISVTLSTTGYFDYNEYVRQAEQKIKAIAHELGLV